MLSELATPVTRPNGAEFIGPAVFVLLILTMVQPAAAASFTPLGDLTGGIFRSRAEDVSADGLVVVGGSEHVSGSYGAFSWRNGVMGYLGDLPGGTPSSMGYAVSADGSVVVGESSSGQGYQAFQWNNNTMASLSNLPGGGSTSRANGVSADGSVIVGYHSFGSGNQAVRWRDGIIEPLGYFTGGTSSSAIGVSANGKVVVGSSNGIVIPIGSVWQAFRWTSNTAMVPLGDLNGGSFFSVAYNVSADGSVVVGTSHTDQDFEAFIWDAINGMRNLKRMLENDGLDLSGWTLIEASAISDDARTIVGRGWNPQGRLEGWLAQLSTIPGLAEIITGPDPFDLLEGCIVQKPYALIELQHSYGLGDIVTANTFLTAIDGVDLAQPLPVVQVGLVGDRDGDLVRELPVGFSRQDLINALLSRGLGDGDEPVLTVRGQLTDGTIFSGNDTLRLIEQGPQWPFGCIWDLWRLIDISQWQHQWIP